MGIAFDRSWSFSRADLFGECQRKFFYEYYSYDDAQIERNHILRLKCLSEPEMMAGTVVEKVIRDCLAARKEGQIMEDLAYYGIQGFQLVKERSPKIVQQLKNELPPPKKIKPFHHDYYEYDPENRLDEAEAKIVNCLNNFEFSQLYKRILQSDPASWSDLRNLDELPPSFRLDGLLIWANFDFTIEEDGCLFILDWKTGKRRKEADEHAEKQLAVYAMYGHIARGFPYENIYVQPVWLNDPAEWKPRTVSPKLIESVQLAIKQTASLEAEKLAEEKDRRGNTVYRANIGDFSANTNPRCAQCKYLEACAEGSAYGSRRKLEPGQPTEAEIIELIAKEA